VAAAYRVGPTPRSDRDGPAGGTRGGISGGTSAVSRVVPGRRRGPALPELRGTTVSGSGVCGYARGRGGPAPGGVAVEETTARPGRAGREAGAGATGEPPRVCGDPPGGATRCARIGHGFPLGSEGKFPRVRGVWPGEERENTGTGGGGSPPVLRRQTGSRISGDGNRFVAMPTLRPAGQPAVGGHDRVPPAAAPVPEPGRIRRRRVVPWRRRAGRPAAPHISVTVGGARVGNL